ncbi:PHP domain-containing protein [Nocardioides sp. AE5]|uniref:PHP domain-containing protein n=1 Tax=Nocardioides sp. AE5 TaxID=2962573 RepID=UPI00288137E4|nr:PHP domain-containing protein [Nocardioides sp. AE5]MDT0202077.1 PHP domain-containing protein [Nocardioides sp. AE5]
MRIDLHTHSRASDGTDSPADLVRAAAGAGLDVLGITDHDTSDGWDEAARAAGDVGIELVRGMEISTRYKGRSVHLLAYLPDPTYPPLVAALDEVLDGRNARVPAILAKLNGLLGLDLEEAEVHRLAGDPAATGRPHIADLLISKGAVADRTEAFERYLKPGRPAYVERNAADLGEMIGIVAAAGGVTVIAHPWGRTDPAGMQQEDLAGLQELGLAGIEIDHQDHSPQARAALRAIAVDLDLVRTGSSDHHGLGKVDHDLGCNTTEPEQYERLVELAAAAAEASGRPAPGVLRP